MRAAQQAVLSNQKFSWAGGGEPPGTFDELWQHPAVHESGTHCVPDVFDIIGPDEPDQPMAVRPLPDADEHWGSRCCTLFDGEAPSGIAFWGISGD